MPVKHFLRSVVIVSACAWLSAQELHPYSLKGTIVTPTEVLADGVISVRGTKIAEVAPAAKALLNQNVIETDGFIFPGLIDLHDHITWNLFPRWKPNSDFANRYEWQQRVAYRIALDTPHRKLFEDQRTRCDANEYGELKAIIGGATSVIGSLGPSQPGSNDNQCIVGLARNLDFYSGFYTVGEVNHEKLRNEVFPFELSLQDAGAIRSALDSGTLKAFLAHVAEGKPTDASSAREFRMFDKQGYLRPGVSIIHGVALGSAQFEQMATKGVGLIWSPRSNIELYGATTDVAAAKRAGVKIALAPDWSPSGSNGVLEELKFAAAWNTGQNPVVFEELELVKMVTLYPADLAGVSDQIGSLKPNSYADILVVRRHTSGDTAAHALLHTMAADVRLVIVGGVPIYGDLDLMDKLLPGQKTEQLTICGSPKALYIEPQPGSTAAMRSWKDLSEVLNSELNAWGTSLAPLVTWNGTNVN
jgi:5-methylthioadenosine/S-adenosylhomocysteine deaminase